MEIGCGTTVPQLLHPLNARVALGLDPQVRGQIGIVRIGRRDRDVEVAITYLLGVERVALEARGIGVHSQARVNARAAQRGGGVIVARLGGGDELLGDVDRALFRRLRGRERRLSARWREGCR